MSAYLWEFVLALLVISGFEAWEIKTQIHKNGVLTEQVQVLNSEVKAAQALAKLTAKVQVAHTKAIASERLKSSRMQAALTKALTDNPSWRDQPVPQEIIDAILGSKPPSVPTAPSSPIVTSTPGVRSTDTAPGE